MFQNLERSLQKEKQRVFVLNLSFLGVLFSYLKSSPDRKFSSKAEDSKLGAASMDFSPFY